MPDVVVLDLMLPGVDGLEVCRRLKADPKTRGIPIVMLTAKGGEADIVAGLELGAADYVTKPFSPAGPHGAHQARCCAAAPTTSDDDATIRIKELTIHPGPPPGAGGRRAGRAHRHRVPHPRSIWPSGPDGCSLGSRSSTPPRETTYSSTNVL